MAAKKNSKKKTLRKKHKRPPTAIATSGVPTTPASVGPEAAAKAGVAQKQLDLPAGFSADGQTFAPLRDVLSPDHATLELAQLSGEQRARLTAERIRLQDKFEVAMVGAGRIDKGRAISEVLNHTEIGNLLTEIENRTIRRLIEKARKAAQK